MLSSVRPLATYASTIGLAIQSHRNQLAMLSHVDQMTALAGQATVLQESVVVDQQESTVQHEAAASKETESAALHDEAAVLQVEATELEAKATGDESEASALQVEAEQDQVAADEAAAHAAADEVLSDESEAVATDAGAQAAADEAGELEDGSAVLVCEFIPLVDILCDGIGAIAGVALEMNAAGKFTEAVTATGEAVAAREDEGVQTAQAAEFETAAATSEEGATELGVKAEGEQADAVADEEEAERDETEAETLQAHAEESETAAKAEQAKAEAEETEADSALKKSAQHGVAAVQNALLATAVGLFAIAYFGGKVLTRTIVGATKLSSSSTREQLLLAGGSPTTLRDLSYCIVHALIFLSSVVLLLQHVQLGGATSYSIRSQGGLTLMFAVGAATVQWSVLHLFPELLGAQAWSGLWEWTLLLIFLVIFFIMEALIVIVNSQWIAAAPAIVSALASVPLWFVWIAMLLAVGTHFSLIRRAGDDDVEEQCSSREETYQQQDDDERLLITEATSLLLEKGQPSTAEPLSTTAKSSITRRRYAWTHLVILVEVLALSCLAVILATCWSHVRGVLWQILQHTTWGWVVPVIIAVYAILVVAVTLMLSRSEKAT